MAIASKPAPNMSSVQSTDQGVIAPVATDLATAIALANDLRMIALNQGTVRAS